MILDWIRKAFGCHVCEKWTKWEAKSADYSRAGEKPTEILAASGDGRYHYTRNWQERRCVECGRIQQQRLTYL